MIDHIPKLSVIIPAYNSARSIGETIESVLRQTFTDWEIVVIDDGSQDDTVKVVLAFNDSRIRLFSFQNGGLPTARNRGFEKSRGKYICFLDADDLWHPAKLERQYLSLINNQEAGCSYTGEYLFSGQASVESLQSEAEAKPLLAAPSGNIFLEVIKKNPVASGGSNYMIARSAFEEIEGFNEQLTSCEDWDFAIRLSQKYHFVSVPERLVFYRCGGHSMSADLANMERTARTVIDFGYELAGPQYATGKRETLRHIYQYLANRVRYPSKDQLPTYLKCNLLHLYYEGLKKDSVILFLKALGKSLKVALQSS